jgi:ABC-type branched-subunit amino acid transport system substrate-binding protein
MDRTLNSLCLRLLPAGLALLLSACKTDVNEQTIPPARTNTVKIGLITTTAPAQASQSSEREYAALLAVEEINAAGGVNGLPLELLLRYDQNRPAASVAVARDLVHQGVVAIIGPSTSAATLAISRQVTIAADVPVLTHGGTSPTLTTLADNDTVYRLPPSDALQGRVLAEQMYAEGIRKLAILYVNDAYGTGLRDTTSTHFLELGGTLSAAVSVAPEQTQLSAEQINSLFAGDPPDALAVFTLIPMASNAIRDIFLQRGALPKLYGSDALSGQELANNLIPQAAGMRLTNPVADTDSPAYQRMSQAYLQRLGQPLTDLATTYDGVYLVALALAQGHSNSARAVKQQLRAVSRADSAEPVEILPNQFRKALQAIAKGQDIDYQGAFGPANFDINGDPAAGVYSYLEFQQDGSGHLALKELSRVDYRCTVCRKVAAP